MSPSKDILIDHISSRILNVRGQRVILDSDLAEFYGVTTKKLNQQVKRNPERFPVDFVFQLTGEEVEKMNRSHFVTGSQKHRDPRFPPYVFTEHGALALAGVIKSLRAAQVSVFVTRAFVKMRQILVEHAELGKKVIQLEKAVAGHDEAIISLVHAIKKLMEPVKEKPKCRIGFRVNN